MGLGHANITTLLRLSERVRDIDGIPSELVEQ